MTRRWQTGLYAASWVLFLLFSLCVSLHAWVLHDLDDGGGKHLAYGYTFAVLPGKERPISSNYDPTWTHAQVTAERARLNRLYARDFWDDTAPLLIALLVLIVALPVQRHLLIQRERGHSPQHEDVRQNSVRFTLWMLFILFAISELYFANALYSWTGIGRYEDYASERQVIEGNESPGPWNDYHPLTHVQADAQRAQLDALYRRELWERSYPLVIALLVLAVAILVQQYLLMRRNRGQPPPAPAPAVMLQG